MSRNRRGSSTPAFRLARSGLGSGAAGRPRVDPSKGGRQKGFGLGRVGRQQSPPAVAPAGVGAERTESQENAAGLALAGESARRAENEEDAFRLVQPRASPGVTGDHDRAAALGVAGGRA